MAAATYELKVRRASEHFGTYQEAVKWWLENNPYRIAEEIDKKEDRRSFVVIAESQPPERLSLMLGDAIQNFRSALDYLIGDLARTNSGGYLMPRIESDLQFPVTTSRGNFKEAVRRGRISLIPPRAAAHIQRLQPYRRGQDPATHPLWVLQQLSNIDKHRRIPLLMSVVRSVQFNHVHVHSAQEFAMGSGGPFKDKAVLLWHKPANAEVDVNLGDIAVGIALGEGLPGTGNDPAAMLAMVTQQIGANVIEPLAAFL